MKKQDFEVYIFKVAFKYDKRTWRRIEIATSQTLDDLHEAIYEAFERDDEHLYSFYFCDRPTSKSHNRHDYAVQFKHPMCFDKSIYDAWEKTDGHNAAKTQLYTLELKGKQKFEYLFDFGDCWWHELTFEGNKLSDGGRYPRISEKRGDSPPQYPDYEDDDYWDDEKEIEIIQISSGKEPVRKKVSVKKTIPAKKKKEKVVKKQKTDDDQPDLFSWADKN